MEKIHEKKKKGKALWVIECPKCEKILASASEAMYLPNWGICDDCNDIETKTIERTEPTGE